MCRRLCEPRAGPQRSPGGHSPAAGGDTGTQLDFGTPPLRPSLPAGTPPLLPKVALAPRKSGGRAAGRGRRSGREEGGNWLAAAALKFPARRAPTRCWRPGPCRSAGARRQHEGRRPRLHPSGSLCGVALREVLLLPPVQR